VGPHLHVREIRLLVGDGLPYLGFSAGSAIAAERAILGGWRIGDVAVCPEDASEDLDEVTVEQGIGLLDVSIDVHAAQWGTVSRLIAAAEAGLIDSGLAIDEVRESIGADTLGYISLDGMVGATEQPPERLCTACFTGKYPIELPDSVHLGKHALEQSQLQLGLDLTDVDWVATGLSGGAADALSRP
jgi:hypothetical protein